jgi:hypothetical protein
MEARNMSDVELVIKIPEEVYEKIQNRKVNQYDIDDICQSVFEGTPLPKGHGALKDVDNIKTAFPNGEYVRTESVRATIDHEDTIIEADKESEDVDG